MSRCLWWEGEEVARLPLKCDTSAPSAQCTTEGEARPHLSHRGTHTGIGARSHPTSCISHLASCASQPLRRRSPTTSRKARRHTRCACTCLMPMWTCAVPEIV